MDSPNRTKTGRLSALALAIGAGFISGCTAPLPQPDREPTTPLTFPARADNIETIVERHRSELEALADLAKKDNIERGGIIISYSGTTKLIEINNQFRDGPELIDRYCQGELDLRGHLDTLITSAASARTGCNPSGAANYYARADNFRTNLAFVQALVGKDCQAQNYLLQSVFAELGLHTTYLRGEREYDAARRLGDVILHVHTHNDLRTETSQDTTDQLAPSGQDLIVSQNQEGLVSGVDASGKHRIYYSTQGAYRLITPETSLALR